MEEIKYPVDSANFRRIREGGFVYVDKTSYIHRMVSKGTYYFLARPRRFGKSLFLDTLAEYFKGSRELFKGLAIDKLQPGDWEEYPVLRFNLSGQAYNEKDILESSLNSDIKKHTRKYEVEIEEENLYSRLLQLIEGINIKTGKKVVILIDEYDSPLTSAIGKPDLQEHYRETLHGFYSVLKKAEEYIQFCMLTGVTRYGKVSVFSGLNNLNDITFENAYAGICGITKEELTQYYDEGIGEFADYKGITKEEAYELLKFHYDGYHFSGCLLDIYNPFSINHALSKKEISDYWCKSGVPTLLSKTLMENDYYVEELTGLKVDSQELSNLSIYHTNPIPLFYQSGYLTLKDYNPRRQRFTLGYPNREVESGILNNILNFYVPGKRSQQNTVYSLEDAFEDGDPEKVVKILKAFMADIPSKLHMRVDRYENYYHTIFYCLVKLIGLDIDAEYNTSEGFIDIVIKTEKYIYVIELKVNGTAEEALRQIEEKHYCAPFEADPRRLYKIGIGFSTESHSIEDSKIES
ncbi:MAG: ATP-binding protein [Muribaculaceae bacterium]|nr:ATP-binding protein [Muribaculaceae bacterium]